MDTGRDRDDGLTQLHTTSLFLQGYQHKLLSRPKLAPHNLAHAILNRRRSITRQRALENMFLTSIVLLDAIAKQRHAKT